MIEREVIKVNEKVIAKSLPLILVISFSTKSDVQLDKDAFSWIVFRLKHIIFIFKYLLGH